MGTTLDISLHGKSSVLTNRWSWKVWLGLCFTSMELFRGTHGAPDHALPCVGLYPKFYGPGQHRSGQAPLLPVLNTSLSRSSVRYRG